MTSCSLIGVASESGIPLFVRHTGPGKPPPFALLGSLNGVHVFGEAQGVSLFKASTETTSVIWKTYYNCIRLIVIQGSECDSDVTNSNLLDLVVGTVVLSIGLTNLSTCKNIERLKKELKPCLPLIDEIIERYAGNTDIISFSHLSNCVEYILPPDQLNIQLELEKFTESLESSHGCLMLTGGQIIFATKSFWNLSGTELTLLSLLVSSRSLSSPVGKDIPVYLPDKSPSVPFRLLLIKLSSSLVLALLCGPTPALPEALKCAFTFWGSHSLTLEAIAAASTCSIPVSINTLIDPAVRGILLINYETKRSLSCVHSQERPSASRPHHSKVLKVRGQKLALLSTVYKSLLGHVLLMPTLKGQQSDCNEGQHAPVHSYISTEEFKVFALQHSTYHLLVLLPPLLPLHIARDVSWKTYEALTKAKGHKV